MRSRAHLTLVRPPHWLTGVERTNKAAGIAIVILVFLFWAQYLRPQSLGGNAGYVLVSGQSMEPRYHTGDLVLVERKHGYHAGELIAYRVPKGDPMAGAQVIHRIIGGDAKHGFIVRGDNRTAPDVWRPKPQDIVGAKALRLPNAIVVLQYPAGAAAFSRSSPRLSSSCTCSAAPASTARRERRGGCDGAPAGRMIPRVLIAEPNDDVRALLELTVQRLGYEAVSPNDGTGRGDVDAMLLEPACAIGRSVLRRFGDDAPPVDLSQHLSARGRPRACGERRLPREAGVHGGDRRCAPQRLRRLAAGLHCAASCRLPAAATS